MILPALLLLLSLLFSMFSALSLQVRCREAAASIARAIERGEDEATWQALLTRSLPEARIDMRTEGRLVVISVRQRSAMRFEVQGEAVALP